MDDVPAGTHGFTRREALIGLGAIGLTLAWSSAARPPIAAAASTGLSSEEQLVVQTLATVEYEAAGADPRGAAAVAAAVENGYGTLAAADQGTVASIS